MTLKCAYFDPNGRDENFNWDLGSKQGRTGSESDNREIRSQKYKEGWAGGWSASTRKTGSIPGNQKAHKHKDYTRLQIRYGAGRVHKLQRLSTEMITDGGEVHTINITTHKTRNNQDVPDYR